jgi:hypothetical protein
MKIKLKLINKKYFNKIKEIKLKKLSLKFIHLKLFNTFKEYENHKLKHNLIKSNQNSI